MERNQKNIEKTKKQKKKNNIWKLLVRTPYGQDLWNIVFFVFFWFSQRFLHFWARKPKNIEKTQKNKKQKYLETLGGTPPSPRPLEYVFLFFFVFSIFFLLCANPPHPQDLWNIFFCFCRCFCWFVPIPPIPKTFKKKCCFIFFVSRQNRIVLCSQCFFSRSH